MRAFKTLRLACCLITPLVLTSSLTGCSFIDRNFFSDSQAEVQAEKQRAFTSQQKEKPAPKTTQIDVEKLKDLEAKKAVVEILWAIPKEPVDSYVIKYGLDEELLDKQLSLKVAEIEKYEDEKFGFVFRHLVSDVPQDRAIFVAIASEKDGKRSEFTNVFKVNPSERKEKKPQPLR